MIKFGKILKLDQVVSEINSRIKPADDTTYFNAMQHRFSEKPAYTSAQKGTFTSEVGNTLILFQYAY